MTTVGIDAHKRTHTLVAVNVLGRQVAERTFPSTIAGHGEAVGWVVERFGFDVEWAVEDNRAVTHQLEQDLLAAGPWRVARVPPHLMARVRAAGRERGKSDPIDALAVARAAQQNPDLPVAVHDAVSWDLRQLVERRLDLVGQRVAVMHRVYGRVHLIDPSIATPTRLDRRPRRDELGSFLRTRSGLLAELARDEVDDLEYLSRRIDSLTLRIVERVDQLESSLLGITGCAHLTAARLIGEAANVDRFANEAAFARYCGAAPEPRWSGATAGRLRSSPWGNRRVNSALHVIAAAQISKPGRGKEYYERRRSEGDSGSEAIRRLKRKLCRLVFNRLRADYVRRRAITEDLGSPSEPVTVEQVPAWLDVVELGAALSAERAADVRPMRSGAAEHDSGPIDDVSATP